MYKNILIYGAGEVGERTMCQLKENHHNIVAFIDQNREGFIDNIPIYTIEKCKQAVEEFSLIPVIICLSNGILHKNVADTLYENGFQYIVFLPMGYGISNQEKVKLDQVYNQVLKGRIGEVFAYKKYYSHTFSETGKIRVDGEQVIAWVGQEVLFSEDISTWTGDLSKVNCVNDGIDVNLNAYCWCHNLFQYLDGDVEDCQVYLDIFSLDCNSERGRKKLLDRECLYHELERQLQTGMECFIEASTQVIWNNKGYFNLVGGHHRTVFLQHKGYVYYPVRMEKDIYSYWKNEPVLEELITYMRIHGIKDTYVPIPNPSFMNIPSKRENKGKGILYAILQYLGPVRLEKKTIVDVSQYEGYFARIARRMCANEVIHYSMTEDQMAFSNFIADLLRLKNITMKVFSETLVFDIQRSEIVFAMGNIQQLLSYDMLKDYAGELFIEVPISEKRDVLDKIRRETRLREYRMLYREVVDGTMMEIGVCN